MHLMLIDFTFVVTATETFDVGPESTCEDGAIATAMRILTMQT
jgi:hypothetical protein